LIHVRETARIINLCLMGIFQSEIYGGLTEGQASRAGYQTQQIMIPVLYCIDTYASDTSEDLNHQYHMVSNPKKILKFYNNNINILYRGQ
jgi:hypothetical protein